MLSAVHKLPQYFQNKWRENVAKARRDGNIPNFKDLASFVQLAAETANDPVYGHSNAPVLESKAI